MQVVHGLGSSRQAISQHLGVLEAAGLVTVRREGRYVYHRLDTTPLAPSESAGASTRENDNGEETGMRITVTSVLVDNQDKALAFYTEVLGFVKKSDIPVGEARWLTVVSPQDPDGTELVLEPDGHPAVGPFKRALVEDGIPYTSFAVEDAWAEFERLSALGVRFTTEAKRLRGLGVVFTQDPLEMGTVTTAVFDDTWGTSSRSPAPSSEEPRPQAMATA